MSDNHTPSDDFDNLFSHLIEYEKSEEFQKEAEAFDERRRARNRPSVRIRSRAYRQQYPEFEKMRREARKHKQSLYEQQKGLCYICGEALGDKFEIDHILALADGGTNDIGNLCVVHRTCNAKKGPFRSRGINRSKRRE